MNSRRFLSAFLINIAIVSFFASAQIVLPARQAQDPGKMKPVSPRAQHDSSRGIGLLPSKAKRFALVIGVDQYTDPQVVGLGGAANDARLLATSLERYAGFPRD